LIAHESWLLSPRASELQVNRSFLRSTCDVDASKEPQSARYQITKASASGDFGIYVAEIIAIPPSTASTNESY
jgi:hypothetical protein